MRVLLLFPILLLQVFDTFLIFELAEVTRDLGNYHRDIRKLLLLWGFIIRAFYSDAEVWDALHTLPNFPGMQAVK